MKGKLILWEILLTLNIIFLGVIIIEAILGEKINILLLITFILGIISATLQVIVILRQNKKDGAK